MRQTLPWASANGRLAKSTACGSFADPKGTESLISSPGVAVVNSNYQYVSINSTLAALHGRSVEDHLGRSIVYAVQASVHPLLLPAYRKVITTGIAVENLMVEALAGTCLKRCAVSYYPVKTAADPLWSVQVIAKDITPISPELPALSQEYNHSPTQLRILQLISECKSNKEIAEMLHISVSTVCTHRRAILQRTNLHTTAELVRYAGTLSPRYPLSRG